MSVDLFVFFSESNLPTTAEWQDGIDRLGVCVRLDASIDSAHHTGFWPAQCGSPQLGFEFYTGSIADAFGAQPPEGLGERDFVANFVTHSDLQELRCAMFAAAALAVVSDGLVFDGETGGRVDVQALMEQAQTIDPPS